MIADSVLSRREEDNLQYPDFEYTLLPPAQIAPDGQGLHWVKVDVTSPSRYFPAGHKIQELKAAVKLLACM